MIMIYPAIWWLSFVCILTLLGNILVILAVLRETSLHSPTYYYVVSLALADLCVGVIVIPLAILFELLEPPPSRILCNIWHITDVGASTASILALCVIAVDRYIAITSPINYSRSFIARHSSIVITIIWFCSALIAGPIVIVLGQRSNSIDIPFERCEFPSDPVFIMVSSSVSFYVPLIIMVFVYGRILIEARKQMTAVRQGYKKTTTGVNEMYQPSPLVPRFRFRTNKNRSRSTSSTIIPNFNLTTNSNEIITLRIHKGKYSRSPSLPPPPPSSSSSSKTKSSNLFLHRLRKLRTRGSWSRFSREHKAAKVLGFVMGVFIACWLPFFVFLVLTGVFHINIGIYQEKLFRLFTWLGYTNSALNFLVYVLTSREFRLAFIKLLCPRRYVQRSLIKHSHQQQIYLQRI